MKVRLGFVSNSSSSSFMIMGIELSVGMPLTNTAKNSLMEKESMKEECKKYYDGDWDKFFSEAEIVSDEMEDLLYDMFDIHYDSEDIKYVGLPPESMEGSETLDEFKQRISNGLKEKGLDVDAESLSWHSDCWMNN